LLDKASACTKVENRHCGKSNKAGHNCMCQRQTRTVLLCVRLALEC
jgi:hypothetical protein